MNTEQTVAFADPSPRAKAYLLLEALVYIGLVFLVLGAGSVALYRCIDNSVLFRRSAADVSTALNTGELWRADVRASTHASVESVGTNQVIHFPGEGRREIAYTFRENTIFRRSGQGAWSPVLKNVKASSMAQERDDVASWKWELELQPRHKGTVKSGRMRPLFTFIAVPEQPSNQ